MIDLLIAQERAKEKAQNNRELAELLRDEEAERADAEREQRRTMGQFFSMVAENSSRFAQMFAEEDVDGEFGLEILRRSGTVKPVKLSAMQDPGFVSEAVNMLERAISTEQK